MRDTMLGRTIKGRYKIIDERGQGNFATVYIARDLEDNHLYAVKILSPDTFHRHSMEDAEIIARFQREAYILQQLSDPHIVRVFDFGEDDSCYFIVMDYIDGKTLKEHMQKQGKMDLPQAFDYVQQIAEGLENTHKHGVIHRDIKPQNILVNRKGLLKIGDFGLARFNGIATVTEEDEVMGTVNYISPEQSTGGHLADIRSDLYSLTVVLFELLVTRPPFESESLMGVILKHQMEAVPSICRMRPDLPTDVDTFIQKGMAKLPEQRFQTPREFLAALDQIRQNISKEGLKPPVTSEKQAYLIFSETAQSIFITEEKLLIGRYDPKRPTKPDIFLEDITVGRSHACLRNRKGMYTIEDLRSRNHTFLNEETLTPGEEYPLKNDDRLRFGRVEGRFELR